MASPDDLNEDDFNSMFEKKSPLSGKTFERTHKGVQDASRARDLMLQAMAAAFHKETGLPADRVQLVQKVDANSQMIMLYFEEKDAGDS